MGFLVFYRGLFHSLIGNVTESLFNGGDDLADYQPEIEERCPANQEHFTLDPNKRCKDRFDLSENGTLVIQHPQDPYQAVYGPEEFCIVIDGHANHKDQHLPKICIDNTERKQRMK